MDAAKSIAALVHADAPTAEYVEGRSADAETTLPCIEIPTTSGTGTEVTPNAVLSVSAKPVKKSIRGKGLLPAVALVDAKLTRGFKLPDDEGDMRQQFWYNRRLRGYLDQVPTDFD